ncbi:MAG: AsmA family protein, partial [Proteobacteria bacterium]|nr:AsmA family protein [Pseudomonadota bacterium]
MSGIARKILKILVYTILVSLLFIATAAGIFVATFDANLYKQDLSELVRQHTGRELQFFGDVSLTVYPALGMKIGAMSFSNAPGFSAQSMVKVNKASISVDLTSLITFNPQIDQLLLEDLEINLQTNAAGATNWDSLIKADRSAPSTSTDSATTAGGADPDPVKIEGSFGGINMQNARLLWKDEQAGVEYRISDFDLKTGRITADAPFALQLHLVLQSADEISASVDLAAKIQYLINDNQLKIDDLNVDIAAEGSVLPNGQVQIGIASQSLLFDVQRNAVKMDGFEFRLDDIQLGGSVNITDFSQPALEFDLAAELLDLDALLGTPPVEQQATVEAPASDADAEDVEIALPMELLRSLHVSGRLSVKQIKLQNLLLEEVKLNIVGKNGLLKLDPITMKLYEGHFQGGVQIDARGQQPKYRVTEKLNGVQMGKLLADLTGEDRVSGELAASIAISTRGERLSELKKNSNGVISIALRDGALKGFNLRYSIDRAKAKLNRQPAPPEQLQSTDFSSLSLSGKIRKGIFSSDDLNLQAPLLRVGGEGKANLNDNTVDYLVNAKLVGTVAGQGGGGKDELKGLSIPVRIKGPFESPDIDVQIDEMLKGIATKRRAEEQAKLKAEIDKQKAELERQLKAEKAALEAAKQRELEKQ